MEKSNVAGLTVNAVTKQELTDDLKNRLLAGSQTWVTTVYSEFLYAGLKDPNVMKMLNKADIAVPDGIGIFWANKFLSIPLTAKSYLGKILQALWQVKYSLAAIIFYPKWIYSFGNSSDHLEKIPGSELIFDIAKMAVDNNLSIYLLGGFGNTSELTASKLKNYSANKLKIAGFSNKNPDDVTIIDDIKKSNADILFVAYGPIKQEEWIYRNSEELANVKLFIGLGGTFDYIAGKKISPPPFIRKIGLEWFFRLITQPYRIKRIYNATFGLIKSLIRYKVFTSYPLRENVAAVILNNQSQILVGERNPKDFYIDIINQEARLKTKGYWQLPQGGIDQNETVRQAGEREAWEETGLKDLTFLKISEKINTYFWNNALRKLWQNRNHKNVGQKQRIVYFKFSGSTASVKMDQKEFINYKWVAPIELEKTIHPERLPLVKIVLADLKEMQEKAII